MSKTTCINKSVSILIERYSIGPYIRHYIALPISTCCCCCTCPCSWLKSTADASDAASASCGGGSRPPRGTMGGGARLGAWGWGRGGGARAVLGHAMECHGTACQWHSMAWHTCPVPQVGTYAAPYVGTVLATSQ